MNRLRLLVSSVVLIFTLAFGVSLAYGQITPSADAYTNSAAPTTNYGANVLLAVDGATDAAYIQFNLASIPTTYTSADITKATLKLYVNTVPTAGSFNVDYVNGAWVENTITHSLSPALGTTIAASVPLTTAEKNQFILIDVTAAVQAWLSGTANDGIALVANGTFNATFDSKESTSTSHAPELDIVFGGGLSGVTTASGSGLTGGGTSGTLNLGLLTSCASGQVLEWNGTAWACTTPKGAGTVTKVASGAGLTGGPITGSGTLSIATGGVTNAMLATSYAQLGAANTFVGNQSVTGNVTAISSGTAGTGVVVGDATAISGTTTGVLGETASTSGAGVNGLSTALTGVTVGVAGDAQSPAGYGVIGSNGATTGIAVGVLGATQSPAGYGVEGTSPYIGVYGTGTTAGVSGVTTQIGGYGVQGTSPSIGVYGTGLYGVEGITTSTSGNGVLGLANAKTGTSSGVSGANYSTTGGAGVTGTSIASSGTTAGVYGTSNSTTGYGVEGAGVNIGVYGTGVAYGVEGVSTGSTGAAGLFVINGGGAILEGENNGTIDFVVDSVGDINSAGQITAAGPLSGSSLVIGGQPFDFGFYAHGNAFLGYAGSPISNSTAFYETAVGIYALSQDSGQYNTAVGDYALGYDIVTGTGNTAIGLAAGETFDGNPLSGSNNTALGANAYIGMGTLNNATAVGAYAVVGESNALVLGGITGLNGTSVNVGIGTSTPGATLEVDGPNQIDVLIQAPESGVGAGLELNTTGTGGLHWEILDTGSTSGQGANKLNIRNVTSGTDLMTILADGHVGIGTTSADNTLSVNGSADKPGGGSWGTFSDARLKTVNGGFTDGLSEIMKIQPIHYRYKPDNAMGIRDMDEHIGVVAQEVQKVIPEAVTENSKGYLMVNNDPIIWTMLNAIKEQQGEVQKAQAVADDQQAELSKALRLIKQQQSLLRAQSAAVRSLKAEVRETREALRKVKAEIAADQPALVAAK